MSITDLFGLLGGLALFLYGMQMMSTGLEAAAGSRMKSILEKLTSNRFLGVLVGAAITTVIQSSSATTVMVVGFVNSGIMTLRQAVWIIMGANIGTTITGQLIALDVGALAPLIAFVGVSMVVFLKSAKTHHIGQITAGLGILFIGMEMMSGAMMPLRESEAFVSMITTFSNPLIGILVGAAFTAVIQSSSASVGILQALASSGVLHLSNAVYVLFGQNIGTCITAVLASIGTSRNAKRTTLIHLMFNLTGTVLFTAICMLTPLTAFVEGFTPDNTSAQIANMHTLFNLVTTLILLPLGGCLADLATRLLPDSSTQPDDTMSLQYLNTSSVIGEGRLGSAVLHIDQLRQEVFRMLAIARKNVELSFDGVMHHDPSHIEQANELEEQIDFLNKEISRYISHALAADNNEQSSQAMSCYFSIVGNIERIGDHAINIIGYTRLLKDKDIRFSPQALSQIGAMRSVSVEAIERLEDASQPGTLLPDVSVLESAMDDMTMRFRDNHLERMKSGICSENACILFSELLTDFERIGDHALNIAQDLVKIQKQVS